jgi:hypothetical protein
VPAIQRQVALVSEAASISHPELMRVSAALQKQATRDLAPIWDVTATVDPFDKLEDVPLGYWPVIVRDDIGISALGVHEDKDGQPFALVSSGPDWALTASHEVMEMLVDPFGNRLVAGDSPKPDQGRVEFLVEVSDPSEAAEFGYTVNGVLLSDFYTPHFFDPIQAAGVRYSFTGAITEPRQVLRGGYLSWHDPVGDHWWQLQFFGTSQTFADLGVLTSAKGSMRSQIDRLTEPKSSSARKGTTKSASSLTAARVATNMNLQSSQSKAVLWRAQIDTLRGGDSPPPSDAPKPDVRRPKRMKGD